jgi:hypothetical protein
LGFFYWSCGSEWGFWWVDAVGYVKPAFWDSLPFDVEFGLQVDCEYGLFDVVFGEPFKNPLEEGFVGYGEEGFGSGAA